MPRRNHDFYETPPHYLKALGSVLALPPDARVIDPCVGQGAVADWINGHDCPTPTTNDLDRKRKADSHLDARDPTLYEDQYDWWITNPPFKCIDGILSTALSCVENVITLARLSALEPTCKVRKSGLETGRRRIFDVWQPDMLIVLPRYCFRLNDKGKRATDSVTCAWIGWGPQVPQVTTIWTERP